MKVPFDSLPDNSRVWIYQSNKKFTDDQKQQIGHILDGFTEQWAAHGKPLMAGYSIEYDQVVILAVNEGFNPATGCSIDSSVEIFRQLESQTGLTFLDKSRVSVDKAGEIVQFPISSLKNAVLEGAISKEDKVVNSHISNLKDLKSGFIQSVGDSWMKRYFN